MKAIKANETDELKKLVFFDITIPFIGHEDGKEIINQLDGLMKAKLTYIQLEEGLTGYQHWQIRGSTKKQYRAKEVFKPFNTVFNGCHITPTNNNCCGVFDYVTKDFTKIDCDFNGNIKELLDEHNKEITTQLKLFLKWDLREYQTFIIEQCKLFEMRKIDIFYDTTGNLGKSLFCEYLQFNNLAKMIPPFLLMEDIMNCVYDMKTYPAYTIDMPRGLKGAKLANFYSGIECLKNGFCYDKRNHYKEKFFNRPRIFIFTNDLPEFDLLSMDRWNVWIINGDFKPTPYIMNNEDSDEDNNI